MKAYDSFQNSMKGIIVMYQNFNRGNLTLQFAIATNPKKPNEIQKGDKIYDYQNSRWFSLSESEANTILQWLRNPQQDRVEIKHYPEGKMTVLTVAKGQQPGTYFLGYSEIQNRQQTFHFGLVLNQTDIMTFANFLQSISLVKTLSAYHDFTKWQSNKTNGNGYSRHQQTSTQQSISFDNTASSPTQAQPSTENQSNLFDANPLGFIKS